MVRCTFSPARAWRLAVGPTSTRTLGSANQAIQSSTQPEDKTVMTQAAVKKIVLFQPGIEGASEFLSQQSAFAGKVPLYFFPRLPAASVTQSTGVLCLTLRSSRAPTACRAGHQAQGLRPILRLLPVTPHRRCRLSSDVRQRKSSNSIQHADRKQNCDEARSSQKNSAFPPSS